MSGLRRGFWESEMKSRGFHLECRTDELYMWRRAPWYVEVCLISPEESRYHAVRLYVWHRQNSLSYTDVKTKLESGGLGSWGIPLVRVMNQSLHAQDVATILLILDALADPELMPLLVGLESTTELLKEFCR